MQYIGAIPYGPGRDSLMHYRTKGSRNGISNTPGYRPIGEKAKGKLIDGRYYYEDENPVGPRANGGRISIGGNAAKRISENRMRRETANVGGNIRNSVRTRQSATQNAMNTAGANANRTAARVDYTTRRVGQAANAAGNAIRTTATNAYNAGRQAVENLGNNVNRAVNGTGNQRPYTDPNGNRIGTTAMDTDSGLRGRAEDAARRAGHDIGNAANAAGRAIGDAANRVGETARNLPGEIDRAWNGTGEQRPYTDPNGNRVGTTAMDTDRGIRGQIEDGARALGHWLGNSARNVSTAVVNAAQTAWSKAQEFGKQAKEAIGNAVNAVIGAAQRGWKTATETVGRAAKSVKDWLSNAWGTIKTGAQNAIGAADRWWNGTGQVANYRDPNGNLVGTNANMYRDRGMRGQVEDFANSAGNAIRSIPDRVGNTAASAYNTASQWVSDRANDVGNAANNLADRVWNGPVADYRDANGNPVGTNVNRYRQPGLSDTVDNVRNAVTGAYNTAAQWVGDRANDVGNAVGGAYNQYVAPTVNAAGAMINHITGQRLTYADMAARLGLSEEQARTMPQDVLFDWYTQRFGNT